MKKNLTSNRSSKEYSSGQMEPLTHFYKHELDKIAFKRKWKRLLWLALLPSFGLDLLAIGAYGYDVTKGNMDLQQMLISIASFITINAIVVKGFTIYYLSRFKEMRERSHILTNDKEMRYICYSMRVGSDATDAVASYYYREYIIKEVESFKIRKDGTVMVRGTIEVTKHRMDIEDEEDICGSVHKKKILKIPAYYCNMPKIIEELYGKTN